MQILNQEIVTKHGAYITLVILSFIIFLIAHLIFRSCKKHVTFVICLICMSASVVLIAFFSELATTNGYYNQYEVIIDESYPAKELYEQYNVIEQRGDIWVIRDKEVKYDNAE